MELPISNITPFYERHSNKEGLTFRLGDEDRGVFLKGKSVDMSGLNRCSFLFDGTLTISDTDSYSCCADNKLSKKEAAALEKYLSKWVSQNQERRFTIPARHVMLSRIETGINVTKGIIVFPTQDAVERMNLKGSSYSILANGNVSWIDRDYGRQTAEGYKKFNIGQPEGAIYSIETRLKQLRVKAGDTTKWFERSGNSYALPIDEFQQALHELDKRQMRGQLRDVSIDDFVKAKHDQWLAKQQKLETLDSEPSKVPEWKM